MAFQLQSPFERARCELQRKTNGAFDSKTGVLGAFKKPLFGANLFVQALSSTFTCAQKQSGVCAVPKKELFIHRNGLQKLELEFQNPAPQSQIWQICALSSVFLQKKRAVSSF